MSQAVFARTVQGYIFLLAAALLWGTAFVFQKSATSDANAFAFNFLRFSASIPALLLLRYLPLKLFEPHSNDTLTQRHWRYNAWVIGGGGAVFMFLGISLQQLGLTYTTAGKSGFLTSLYIVIVPMLALLFRQRCHREVWLGAAIALLGVYLLGSGGGDSGESQFNRGDVMTLLSAIAWAAHVLWLGAFARYANVLTIVTVQMSGVAVFSGVVMVFLLLVDGTQYPLPTPALVGDIKAEILYTGVVSTAVAFTLQIFGQRHVPPANAALIMSSEAIFALLAGVVFLSERLTVTALLGCLLILLGVIAAQLGGKLGAPK